MTTTNTGYTHLACNWRHGADCLVSIDGEWHCRHRIAANIAKPLAPVFLQGTVAWRSAGAAERNGWPVIVGATPEWTDADAQRWWGARLDAFAADRAAEAI